MAEKKVKKTMAKKKEEVKKPKVTELMELQNIVVQMHKKMTLLESNLNKVLKRMGL
jgi:hypothetical protein